LISAVDPRSVERVRATGKHAIFESKAVSYTDLVMRFDRSPGSNPDFGLSIEVKRMPADGYWSTHWVKHPVGSATSTHAPAPTWR
jgi:hypothetical protein